MQLLARIPNPITPVNQMPWHAGGEIGKNLAQI